MKEKKEIKQEPIAVWEPAGIPIYDELSKRRVIVLARLNERIDRAKKELDQYESLNESKRKGTYRNIPLAE